MSPVWCFYSAAVNKGNGRAALLQSNALISHDYGVSIWAKRKKLSGRRSALLDAHSPCCWGTRGWESSASRRQDTAAQPDPGNHLRSGLRASQVHRVQRVQLGNVQGSAPGLALTLHRVEALQARTLHRAQGFKGSGICRYRPRPVGGATPPQPLQLICIQTTSDCFPINKCWHETVLLLTSQIFFLPRKLFIEFSKALMFHFQ